MTWARLRMAVAPLLIGTLAGVGLFGCDKKPQDSTQASEASAGGGAKTSEPSGPPLTEDEVLDFAHKLQETAERGDIEGFNRLIDWDAIFETATSGLNPSKEARDAFMRGVKNSLNRVGIIHEIIKAAAPGGEGSFVMLRVHQKSKRPWILFRMLAGPSRLAYFEFIPERRSDGTVRAIDLFTYSTGELTSETFRRAFLPVAAQASRGIVDRLLGKDQEFVENLPTITEMTQATNQGRFRDALAAYQKLSEGMKKDKNLLLIRIRAAQGLREVDEKKGNAAYAQAMEDLRRFHPNDPSLDLILIDAHVLEGRLDEAMACIDRLDKEVGGDPYLDVFRASVRLQKGDNEGARKLAQSALDQDSGLMDAYWLLVTIALREEDYDKVLALLQQGEQDYQLQFHDLKAVPDYAGFIQSPQYQEWLKTHPAPAPEPTPEAGPDAQP